MKFSTTILPVLGFALNQVSAFSVNDKNVALYWGQNSAGGQTGLKSYCESDEFDIVIVSFLNNFPELGLNLANQCGTTFDSGLLHCPTVGLDIKYCQLKGKKVLLALGGAYGNYGFSSDSEATAFADTLWNKFGAGSDSERPFDDAVVDGFDFDFEKQNQVGTVALAQRLRTLYGSDSSKQYFLSASPQCPFPDASVSNVLSTVPLDFAFIQFYNNQCSLNGQFNWNAWQSFAETAPNSNIKLYVGLPGAQSSAGSGFVDLATVQKQITPAILASSNFGGFSLWDASSATSNVNLEGVNFYQQLKRWLKSVAVATSSSSSTTSTTSSTSTIVVPQTSSAKASATSVTAPYGLNSTSTGKSDDSTVVKTTVIEEIYTTICPDVLNGGLTTSVATTTKTVTFTGECECTKKAVVKGKESAAATTTPAPAPAPAAASSVPEADQHITVTTLVTASKSASESAKVATLQSQSSSVAQVLTYTGGSSQNGLSVFAILAISLILLF